MKMVAQGGSHPMQHCMILQLTTMVSMELSSLSLVMSLPMVSR